MPNQRRSACLILAICSLTPNSSLMADSNLRGYLKSYAISQQSIDNALLQADQTWQSQSSLRLMWQGSSKSTSSTSYAWELHYEASPVFSNQLVGTGNLQIEPPANYRLTDIDPLLVDEARRPVLQNLDRLNIQLQFDQGDLTIGRQAITFGSARIINPTDVFLPYNVTALNTEYRIGVDAIRYQQPLGQLGELDMGFIFGKDAHPDSSAAFIHGKTNLAGTDLEFAAMRYAKQTLLGAGMQSALGSLGFWLETAVVNGDRHYWRTSTGVDYAFSESMFGMVEYHYNGAGATDSRHYLNTAQTSAYQAGGVFLLGQHYLIPSLSFQATALTTLGLQAIVNLKDKSSFWSISATHNVLDDLYLGLGYYHFIGKPPVANQVTPFEPGYLAAEYGTSPNSVYVQLSYYF